MIEGKEAIRGMANETTVGPDTLPVEMLKFDDTNIVRYFYGIFVAVWPAEEGSRQSRGAKIKVLHKKKDCSG